MTLRSRMPRLTLSPEILVLQENLNCSSLHDFASKQKCHVEDHSVFCDHHHHHGVHQISIYMIYMIVQIRPLVLNLGLRKWKHFKFTSNYSTNNYSTAKFLNKGCSIIFLHARLHGFKVKGPFWQSSEPLLVSLCAFVTTSFWSQVPGANI